jgi:oligoendopeptidase F
MRAKEARYTFSESLKLVRDAFGALDPKFCEIVDTYAHNGQLDVYPKRGKSGGAFCSHLHGLPTYILLNHVDTFNSFTTLAHEAGHGIHSELSAAQPVWYEGYSTAVAETASTFFEGIAFDHATKHLKGIERIKVLHDRIQNDISTIFRQIAFFNFELELLPSILRASPVPHTYTSPSPILCTTMSSTSLIAFVISFSITNFPKGITSPSRVQYSSEIQR